MTINLHTKKRVANWLSSCARIISQFLVSSWSFLTLPMAKFGENAAKDYFEKLYQGRVDPLLFDGKDWRYLEQIEMVIDVQQFNAHRILDIGCGNGSLYQWLHHRGINPSEYLGIDVGHPSKKLGTDARILQTDVHGFNFQEMGAAYFTVVNTLCYLNDEIAERIMATAPKGSKIIIIEPWPGLFWDAHFAGIQLYYRKPEQMIQALTRTNWKVEAISLDYLLRFMDFYLIPLSYCVYAANQS